MIQSQMLAASTLSLIVSGRSLKMKVFYRGRGCEITEDDGSYRIPWEQGLSGETVQYEISKENAEKAMESDDGAYAVKVFAETGKWPLTEEEQLEETKNFIRKSPKLLLTVPENQKLFSQEELEKLLEKAKNMQ